MVCLGIPCQSSPNFQPHGAHLLLAVPAPQCTPPPRSSSSSLRGRDPQDPVLRMRGVQGMGASEPLPACLPTPPPPPHFLLQNQPILLPGGRGAEAQGGFRAASSTEDMRHLTCDPPQEILPTSETNLRRETMTPEWTEGSAEASPPLPQPTMAQLSKLLAWRLSQPTSRLRSQPWQRTRGPEKGSKLPARRLLGTAHMQLLMSWSACRLEKNSHT